MASVHAIQINRANLTYRCFEKTIKLVRDTFNLSFPHEDHTLEALDQTMSMLEFEYVCYTKSTQLLFSIIQFLDAIIQKEQDPTVRQWAWTQHQLASTRQLHHYINNHIIMCGYWVRCDAMIHELHVFRSGASANAAETFLNLICDFRSFQQSFHRVNEMYWHRLSSDLKELRRKYSENDIT